MVLTGILVIMFDNCRNILYNNIIGLIGGTMSLRRNLSMKLREAKKLSGLKYADIMEITHLSKTSINNALNGGNETSLESFDKLFSACGFTVDIDITLDEKLDDFYVVL